MKNKVGAPSKFGEVETAVLRISRVVPKSDLETYKTKVQEFINNIQSQALDKCVAESYKK